MPEVKRRRKKPTPIEEAQAKAVQKNRAAQKSTEKPPVAPLPRKTSNGAMTKTETIAEPAGLYEIPGLPHSGGPRAVTVADNVHLDLPPDIAQWVWSIVEARGAEMHKKYVKYDGVLPALAVYAKRAESAIRLFRAAIPGTTMGAAAPEPERKRKTRKKAS